MSIKFRNTADAVTVRISGRAHDNLMKVTAIFNRWDNADNTPADIVRRFMCDGDYWQSLDALDRGRGDPAIIQTLPGMICDAYDNEVDVSDLEAAFKADGLSVVR